MSRDNRDLKCKDIVAGVVEATIEQIPVVNFFNSAILKAKEGCLRRRFDNWQKMINERLATLEDAVFNTIGDNETFATTLLKATELASISNNKKMGYIANAVKYTAENDVDEDSLLIMLNCISKYTNSHILILKYLENPALFSDGKDYIGGGVFTYFDKHYSDFNSQLKTIILQDLYRDGLVTIGSDAIMTKSGMEAKRTTNLGDLFITIFGIENENQ